MKKEISILGIIAALSFLFATALPCQADDVVCGCAKTKKGTFRIIDCSSQCLKSEYPVTLSGSAQQNQNPNPNFEGELCWSMELVKGDPGAPEGTVILIVKYLGNENYSMVGTIWGSPVSGSGIINENNIALTLMQSGSDENGMATGIISIVLAKSSLEGIAEVTGHHYEFVDPVSVIDHNYLKYNLTLVQCP